VEPLGSAFMVQDFARHHQIPHHKPIQKKKANVKNGRPIKSGDITHICKVGMQIRDHEEQLPMFVMKLGHFPMVLEIPWLQSHDVMVHFASNTVTF
jgi:hypothetical protein